MQQSLAAQAQQVQQDQAAQAQIPGSAFMSPMGLFGGAQPQAAPNSTGGLPPGVPSTSGAASRVCPSLLSCLWSSADNGQMAMDYFGSSSVTNMVTIIVTLCALLPVAQFAPGYTF